MSDKKPNVFPSKEQISSYNKEKADLEAYEREKPIVMDEIYTNATAPEDTPESHESAVEQMRRRTEEQLRMHSEIGKVIHPELSETKPKVLTRNEQEILEIRKKAEEQMRIRDEHLANNVTQTNNYQSQYNEAYNKPREQKEEVKQVINTPVKQQTMEPQNYGKTPSSIDSYMIELSQPNYNSPFDVIPLPSEGKLYRSKKSNVRVSYMTTADENILTSPNLIKSGEFLEILINRKLLEPEIRYGDLHVGDRNAIMLWLRATGYGEMYPVTIYDENDEPFDTEINLNELKYKPLGAEPDAEGLFDFTMPLSKAKIKFKFLTCGELDEIERMVQMDKENEIPIDNSNTYALEKMIIEVNGNRDRDYVKSFINNIRIKDGKDFSKYTDEIESGVDLNITVETPGGGSVDTFLPLNLGFFWPDFRL
jgi:hypothetical protein